MNITSLKAALILSVVTASGLAVADDGIFELYTNDVRLPPTANGYVSHRKCPDSCAFTRAQFTAEAAFELNGSPVSYDEFRRVFREVRLKPEDITVLYDNDGRRVRLLSLYVSD